MPRPDKPDSRQATAANPWECPITFAKLAAEPEMVPARAEAPEASDFLHWSELIADAIAAGSRMAEVRAYLKPLARTT